MDFHTFWTSKSEQITREAVQKSNFRLPCSRRCLASILGRCWAWDGSIFGFQLAFRSDFERSGRKYVKTSLKNCPRSLRHIPRNLGTKGSKDPWTRPLPHCSRALVKASLRFDSQIAKQRQQWRSALWFEIEGKRKAERGERNLTRRLGSADLRITIQIHESLWRSFSNLTEYLEVHRPRAQ